MVICQLVRLRLLATDQAIKSTGTRVQKETLERAVQSRKAFCPAVKVYGSDSEVSPVQLKKACSPTLRTLLGSVRDVRPPQSQNALLPTCVSDRGKLSDVRPLHSAKACDPSLVSILGRASDVR